MLKMVCVFLPCFVCIQLLSKPQAKLTEREKERERPVKYTWLARNSSLKTRFQHQKVKELIKVIA